MENELLTQLKNQTVLLDGVLPANVVQGLHTIVQVLQYGGLGIGVTVVLFTLVMGIRKDPQHRREAWDNVLGIVGILLVVGGAATIINWLFTAFGVSSFLPGGII